MHNINTKKAFSILELSIAMAVMAILTTAITPSIIHAVQMKAAEKSALEIALIQDAAKNYFLLKKKWPSSTDELKENGLLSNEWNVENPWGKNYVLNIKGNILSVATELPEEWTMLVKRYLPAAVIKNNNIVSSSISSPSVSSTIESGVIVAWSGLIANIPSGWLLCDGTNNTPDLRDKFIVGSSVDSDGESKTVIMSSQYQHILSKTGGSTTHNHGGETEQHVLTIAEMPSHQHSSYGEAFPEKARWGVGPEGRGHIGDGGSDYDNYYYLTSPVGGDQGHAHTIAVDNHVPPFYALAFIMKI